MTEQAEERTRKRRRSRNKFENLSLPHSGKEDNERGESGGGGEDGETRERERGKEGGREKIEEKETTCP